MPAGRSGPFRTCVRFNVAVDRLSGASERHATGCMEFRDGAGLWSVVSFADEAARDRWADPIRTAFRILADSGFGGERSRGWGRAETPEFTEGSLPDMILGAPPAGAPVASFEEPGGGTETEPVVEHTPAAAPAASAPHAGRAQWLLSLFTPASADAVDWDRGNYTVLERGGRIQSSAGPGALKKQLQMVAEGSVLYSTSALRGAAPDVAPDGFAHPVFHAGFALAIPLPEVS